MLFLHYDGQNTMSKCRSDDL